ncbi:helix-turn-helix domain-containing protein [Streptomyces scabiei]|uniref:helix-turn-helix domain-containing protein n=1 Tax=Streptomyces scabiei TaxID=1930 RepID=UPI0033E97277
MTQQSGLARFAGIKSRDFTRRQRAAFAKEVAARYEKDTSVSIRQLCEETGRSYGMIRRLLTQQRVTLRPRGGNQKKVATE